MVQLAAQTTWRRMRTYRGRKVKRSAIEVGRGVMEREKEKERGRDKIERERESMCMLSVGRRKREKKLGI